MPGSRRASDLTGPLVVDASVAVEYLVGLRFTAQAQLLIRGVLDRDIELWAPDLLYPESASAIRKLLRLRAIGPAEADRAVSDLLRLPITGAATKNLLSRVWALRDALTPYDACYVALADMLGAPLVTADQRLAASPRARRIGAVLLENLI